jgi:hypothetical protein
MKKISIFFLLLILIIGCAKTKEQTAEKCLLQANQTFAQDWRNREIFFNHCMADNLYFWSETCGDYAQSSDGEKLSSHCYKYN